MCYTPQGVWKENAAPAPPTLPWGQPLPLGSPQGSALSKKWGIEAGGAQGVIVASAHSSGWAEKADVR